jgi:4-amino-4-deoxy-L-arabinose transferase-like glycosyltransferase
VRIPTLAVLAVALAVGGYLRFTGLGMQEMSADEGASWAAAAAPSAAEVLRLQARLNPGKLGVHDLALHLWMRTFGDSAGTMRTLSATAGTLAIVIVYLLTNELLRAGSGVEGVEEPPAAISASARDLVAAIAALFFAVNLVTIKYSREARMYPLALLFAILQVWLFLRAARRGAAVNYIGTAVFTGLCVATNLTGILILLPEGIWLLATAWGSHGGPPRTRGLRLAASLACGLVLIMPLAIVYLRVRSGPTNPQAYGWIPLPPLYAPLSLFNKATGSFAFPVMAALALFGAIRGWKYARGGVLLATLWMFVPPAAALAFSYAIQPAFLERYFISSFVPFFVLDAVGVWALGRDWVRVGALALLLALALGHVILYDRKPHDVQWREAAIIATANVSMDGAVVVAPGYAVNVVRYYLRRAPAVSALPVEQPDGASVAIIAEEGVASVRAAQLRHDYAHQVMSLRGVVIRQR